MDGEKPVSLSLGTAGFGSDELLSVGVSCVAVSGS